MSYGDALRVILEGDKQAGAKYIRTARRLVFALLRQVSDSGVTIARRVYNVERGVTIDVSIHGLEATAVITVIIPKPEIIPPQRGFVVWARTDALLNGIDATWPEQILRGARPPDSSEEAPLEWKTFVKNDDVTLGRRDGTYGAVLPGGIRHNGNVDWIGPDDERLSWYGPTLRYWCDRWRQPSAMYGRFVFLLGQVLLDIDDYCERAQINLGERKVLGACLRGNYLYVMQAEIDDMPPASAPFGRAYDVYVTPPYYPGNVSLRLVRYRVAIDPAKTDPRRYKVLIGSHKLLWNNFNGYTVNPWVFAPDGKSCETMVMPDKPHVGRYVDAAEAVTFALPSSNHQHVVLTMDERDEVTVVVTTHGLAVHKTDAPAECLIATDFAADGTRLELFFGYEAFEPPYDYTAPGAGFDYFESVPPWANYYLRLGANRINLFTSLTSGNNNEIWASLLTLDLRSGAFVMDQTRRDPVWESFDFHQATLFYLDGELHHTDEHNTFDWPNGGPPFHTGWQSLVHEGGGATFSPLSMMFGSLHTGIAAESVFPWAYYDDTGFNPVACLHKPEQAFGLRLFYDEFGTGAAMYTLSAQLCPTDAPFNAHLDKHEFTHPLGLAVDKGALLYSGPRYLRQDAELSGALPPSEITTTFFITDGELPAVTGIDGENARYHPLWVLGSLPKRSIK